MRWSGVRLLCVLAALATGCVVVRPPHLHERPRWRVVSDAAYEADCVLGQAFVRKSGKAGFGVSLQLRSRRDCSFQVVGARLVFAGGPTLTPAASTQVIALPGRSQLYAWLPIRFDNDHAWNSDRDAATLELDVTVAGAPAPAWRVGVVQR